MFGSGKTKQNILMAEALGVSDVFLRFQSYLEQTVDFHVSKYDCSQTPTRRSSKPRQTLGEHLEIFRCKPFAAIYTNS